MNIGYLLESVLKLQIDDEIFIDGEKRRVKFFGEYSLKHYPNQSFFKLFFDDGKWLEICPESESCYICNYLQRPVDRNLIIDYGETLEMNGNEFRLNDAQDHQTLRKVYFGDITDGEGDGIFSTYLFAGESFVLADDDKNRDSFSKEIPLESIRIN